MSKEVETFLNEICLDLGICDPLYEAEKFTTREYYNAQEFVKEIFIAEGLDPDIELSLFRRVYRRFTDKFGSEFLSQSIIQTSETVPRVTEEK
jgi:hypothetical protein